MRIDLHLHSTVSDGAFPPDVVVQRAAAAGLAVIAITDHDTTGGVREAQRAAGDDVRVLAAVEISAALDGASFHILGYCIDLEAPGLRAYVARARHGREERIRAMLGRLADLDVTLDYAAVLREAGPHVHSLARPHLARALLAAGHVESVSEAFDRFIGDAAPAFLPTELIGVEDAIRLIHDAGGVAVWAHPPAPRLDPALGRLLELGLDGLECYRPRLPDGDLARLLKVARKRKLLITGGSDWHGDWQGDLGAFWVDREQVAAFLERGGL